MTDRVESTDAPPDGEGGGSVTVVGTAHVSEDSVEEVERTIEQRRPDVVAVELDEGRYRQMKGETPEDLDAGDLLRGNTVFQFLAYWMLSYVQTRLGEQFDVSPGADMLAAVETAEELGLGVALVDRDIQMTIQRFWARLSLREKFTMFLSLFAGLGDPLAVATGLSLGFSAVAGMMIEAFAGPVLLSPGAWSSGALPGSGALGGLGVAVADGALLVGALTLLFAVPLAVLIRRYAPEEEEEELDMSDLTDADVVTAMMEEFRRFSPGGAEALIDERDAYIAHELVSLREAGHEVVAIVGAGHREGIEEYLAHPERLPPKESLVGKETGGRFSLYKLFGYAITLGFLAFFLLLAMAVATGVPGASSGLLIRVFGAWFLVNGVFAFAFAKVAGGHWTSAGVGGAVAWLTSVNPLLAPGWFAGYVELRYLDVNVGDIATLNRILEDEESPLADLVARMREVPLFRLMLVVAMTNVASMIASALFAAIVLPSLAADVGGIEGITRLMLQGARNSAELLWGVLT
ncbi:TraB/GumN family protein [Halomicrobium urmianum]|uniref:TraB/GumN family protein n=1 Tax=Halomicrobium urmianum TaxID=1586233 RepID=UPI001CD9DAB4|nr:TraB/GumN family protein [Halomicrobium urmianum]